MTFTLLEYLFSNVANDIHACSYIVMYIHIKIAQILNLDPHFLENGTINFDETFHDD